MPRDENGRYSMQGTVKVYSWVREGSPFAQQLDRMGGQIVGFSRPASSAETPSPPPPDPE